MAQVWGCSGFLLVCQQPRIASIQALVLSRPAAALLYWVGGQESTAVVRSVSSAAAPDSIRLLTHPDVTRCTLPRCISSDF